MTVRTGAGTPTSRLDPEEVVEHGDHEIVVEVESGRRRIGVRITVADDEGVWLTIKGAELDWNRLALLRGRFWTT